MSIFNVERDAVPVGLLGNQSTTLTVLSGDTLYYADNSQVNSTNNQGSLTSGNSATFTENVWIVSATSSSVSQSFTAAPTGGGGGLNGVTVNGAPSSGQVLTATSSSAAGWQAPATTGFGAAWVDMCAAPYSVTPGTDITSALQTAINAANTNNRDTTIFFSVPGTYNINGTPQSGSGTINAGNYYYNGQIVFPARHFNTTNGKISIRLLGVSSVAGFEWGDPTAEPVPAGGTVLQSNGAPFTTLSAGLSTGAAITSLPVAAIGSQLASGATVTTVSGANVQTWTLTALAAAGATSLTVASQTPNFAYPSGSNVAAGWIFDASPADNLFGSGTPATDIHVQFENIVVRGPSNPQGYGAINGLYLTALKTAGSGCVDTTNSNVALTGSGIGIRFPPLQNMALSRQEGDFQVFGWPTAVQYAEHFVADNLSIARCINGVQAYGNASGHIVTFRRLLVQGVQYPIIPSNSGHISGHIDTFDDGGPYKMIALVNDPTNALDGQLVVGQRSQQAASPGFPMIGAQNLRLVPYAPTSDLVGTLGPQDDFTRNGNLQTGTTGNYIGVTSGISGVHIPWRLAIAFGIGGTPAQTNWITNGNNNLKSSGTSTWPIAYLRYRTARAQPSRVVRATWTLSGTYNAMVVIGYPVSGANAGNLLAVSLNAGTATLFKRIGSTSTNLAAGGTVAAANTYIVDIIISNPVSGPYVVGIALNGVLQALTLSSGGGSLVTFQGVANGGYQLSATEFGQFTDTDTTHTQDGLAVFSDTASSCSFFGIAPN